MANETNSKGHLEWIDGHEYYIRERSGKKAGLEHAEIYRAPSSSVIDTLTGYRFGRYVCLLRDWAWFRGQYFQKVS